MVKVHATFFMTVNQLKILLFLCKQSSNGTELAEKLGIPLGSMTNTLNHLEENKYIAYDVHIKKNKYYVITEKGRILCQHLLKEINSI